jgi:hypothetical protein
MITEQLIRRRIDQLRAISVVTDSDALRVAGALGDCEYWLGFLQDEARRLPEVEIDRNELVFRQRRRATVEHI